MNETNQTKNNPNHKEIALELLNKIKDYKITLLDYRIIRDTLDRLIDSNTII